MTFLLAGAATFAFTTVLTIAGVGAAFILIPVFLLLGVDLRTAMATALLLNAVSMAAACVRFIRARLVDFPTALPILAVAVPLAPLGAYTSRYLPVVTLKWLFVGFLLFAATMMFFHRGRKRSGSADATVRRIAFGSGIGAAAGYLGGLLGVGGGNFVVPVLVWRGMDAKVASATTAFVVLFASLSGFFGHAAAGSLDPALLFSAGTGSLLGSVLGSHLMTARLKGDQVKRLIGAVLYAIAAQMAWKLAGG